MGTAHLSPESSAEGEVPRWCNLFSFAVWLIERQNSTTDRVTGILRGLSRGPAFRAAAPWAP